MRLRDPLSSVLSKLPFKTLPSMAPLDPTEPPKTAGATNNDIELKDVTGLFNTALNSFNKTPLIGDLINRAVQF